MFQFFKVWLIRRALLVATHKMAPRQVALSGREAEANDFFSSRVISGDAEYSVRRVAAPGIAVRRLTETGLGKGTSIANARLTEYRLEISRFYGSYTCEYGSAIRCLWSEFSLRPARAIFLDRVKQGVFNAGTPERTKRIEVLKWLLQHRIEHRSRYAVSSTEISGHAVLAAMYGMRIYSHPQLDPLLEELNLTLESLVETGDVQKTALHTTRRAKRSRRFPNSRKPIASTEAKRS